MSTDDLLAIELDAIASAAELLARWRDSGGVADGLAAAATAHATLALAAGQRITRNLR